MEHAVARHLGIRHDAGADDVLGIVDVDVPHERKPEQAHGFLPVDEQDHARLALPLEARQQALARGLEKPLLDHRLQGRENEEEPEDLPEVHAGSLGGPGRFTAGSPMPPRYRTRPARSAWGALAPAR